MTPLSNQISRSSTGDILTYLPSPGQSARRSRGYNRSVNAWHDVELGEPIERHFRCVIEIPKGSKVKYELDKQTGVLWLDRVLHSA
ncbi:MAG: inorganic diphosphatase, partial [bacterium]